MQKAGAEVEEVGSDALRVRCSARPKATDVTTEEYPGFATDLQAQYMALMTQAEGTCVISEYIFENRFQHAVEMNRMGARIEVSGRDALVQGPSRLHGERVQVSDIRSGAALVIAALFNPLRKRVQHAVDRRFNRARYDADQTVGAFAARLQDAVDPSAVQADLLSAVQSSLEPAHASLWLSRE